MLHLASQNFPLALVVLDMRLLSLAFLLFPILLSAQATPEPYHDGLLSVGAADNAPAIDVKAKFKIYGGRTVAPRVLLFTLLEAGTNQWENSPGQWGRGWDGYGKRYGTDLARTGIRDMFAFGVDSALHLDPRFFRAPDSMSTGSRFSHALKQVVIAHTDSGGRSFAYGSVLGAFAAGEAGTLWIPKRSGEKYSDGLIYAGILLAGDAGLNLIREFWPDVRHKFRHEKTLTIEIKDGNEHTKGGDSDGRG